MYVEDTIAAVATPPGRGGIGIVRISGARSLEIAARIFFGRSRAADWAPHRLYRGTITAEDGAPIDDALAVFNPRPRSYTGEDVVELHCHGSPVALRRVLALVLGAGARLAEPGEFSRRAFLNGRLDLAQAEAVVDLIDARTDAAASLAARQLAGHVSGAIENVRARIVRLKALLEAQIDFSDEDFHVGAGEVCAELDACVLPMTALADSYRHGALVRDGLRTAIVGKPNVGKSSLLNALLGRERAIVTPIAGTTRDSIEESADFGGLAVVLTDTAGLREGTDGDTVEHLGMRRTVREISQAQLVLVVLDASRPLDAADLAVLDSTRSAPRLIVLNKIDLPRLLTPEALTAAAGDCEAVRISAGEGVGLAELRRAVVARAHGGTVRETHDEPVLTNVRHHAALRVALDSLALARRAVLDGVPADLVAVDVQDALDRLGEITGVVTSEDVLDRIFAEFCIGK